MASISSPYQRKGLVGVTVFDVELYESRARPFSLGPEPECGEKVRFGLVEAAECLEHGASQKIRFPKTVTQSRSAVQGAECLRFAPAAKRTSASLYSTSASDGSSSRALSYCAPASSNFSTS